MREVWSCAKLVTARITEISGHSFWSIFHFEKLKKNFLRFQPLQLLSLFHGAYELLAPKELDVPGLYLHTQTCFKKRIV
jgi:hypothetical protein